MNSPFVEAPALLSYGLAVIPCPHYSDNGKSPSGAVKGHSSWEQIPSKDFVERLAIKWGHSNPANIGIITGLSGVTVVDVDDIEYLNAMIHRCGDTPLKTKTPRGGVHLWYKNNGEKETTALHGLKVDVKGDKGIIVIPPSYRPDTGQPYEFMDGTWDCLKQLQPAHPGSLPLKHSIHQILGSTFSRGTRNEALFRYCLFQAHACDNIDALQDVALTFNEQALNPPLDLTEIHKTVTSVWRYQTEGKNWCRGEAHFQIPRSRHNLLRCNPKGSDAFMLLAVLKMSHGAREKPFAVSSKGMAKANVIHGWTSKRYTGARETLCALGFLERVHTGGACRGDTHRFVLREPKGAQFDPNIIIPLPPSNRNEIDKDDWRGNVQPDLLLSKYAGSTQEIPGRSERVVNGTC